MLKKSLLFALLFVLLLSACTTASQASEGSPLLTVTDGEVSETYTQSDLQVFPSTQATFNDVTYKGVTLKTLLREAGFPPNELRAVKVTASDGYSVNYDSSLFLRDDVIVAYATATGALAEEDGTFRMVLPGEAGKVNVRMLTTIQAMP